MEKNTKIIKPNFFIYYLFGPIVCLFIRIKYKIKIKRTKVKKGSLIICPHRSYYDAILAPYAVYPKRVHIMSTTLWFRNKFFAHLFHSLGVIPKDQFKNDVVAIKNIVSCLKKKENILIFAEGQMSIFGDSLNLPNGIDKLITKFKPNVYFITSKGAYMSSNRWNRKFERGYFESEVIQLFDSSEKESYTEENVLSKLNKCYQESNEFNYLESNPNIKIKKKDISTGLSHVLYTCPKCHEILPFSDNDNKLVCKKCGYSLEFEKNSYLFKENKDFKHLGKLFEYERKEFNIAANKDDFKLQDEVDVSYYDDKFDKHELGTYTLSLENNTFTLNNDKEKISISIDKLTNIVMNFNKGVELPLEDHTYICNFKNPKNVFLYWNYINR